MCLFFFNSTSSFAIESKKHLKEKERITVKDDSSNNNAKRNCQQEVVNKNESKVSLLNNQACIPEKRNDWSSAYSDYLRNKYPDKGSKKILFIGDSLIQQWSNSANHKYPGGQEIWNQIFKPIPAANFGIAGDCTENLLWRITEGKLLEHFNPEVVVIMIGTNNIHSKKKYEPIQIAEGIKLIVDTVRGKLPNSKILLLGIFPRFDDWKSPKYFESNINEINKTIAKYDDGKNVFFMNIGKKFLNSDGSIKKELFRDGLHLTPKGYQIWADNMNPYLLDILNNDGKGDIWTKK
jgi:lysophospholipase L1-like esterase